MTRTVQFPPNKVFSKTITTTDAQGRFHFDALVGRSLLAKFPLSQPLVWQELHIRYQGKEYLAWDLVKYNLDSEGEFSKYMGKFSKEGVFSQGELVVIKIPVLTCELTSKPRDVEIAVAHTLETICTW